MQQIIGGFMWLINSVMALLKPKTTPKVECKDQQNPIIIEKPIEAIPTNEHSEIDWLQWTKKAASISSTFEGKGGDYANVTGNFDGAYLTCGLLGLTWKYGNQVKIIDEYLKLYGPNKLQKLMPKSGNEYLEAVNAGEQAGSSIVANWSHGSANVKEPYKSELEAFWSSPEMVELQDKTYEKMMGVFAKKKCIETKDYFKNEVPKFEHYAYWWDQAVLNGTGKTIEFSDAINVSIEDVLEFVRSVGGYNKSSNRENYKLWSLHINNMSEEKKHLFKMGYLRALKSRDEFKGTTMMRRGTLALGIGFVNLTLRKYEWFKS